MLTVLISLLTFAQAQAPAARGLAGHWEGGIVIQGSPLAIVCEFARDSKGAVTGKISIPAQGLADFPLGGITEQDGAVSFTMPGVPGRPSFKGNLAENGVAITGNFTQAGQTFAFRLEKRTGLVRPATARPQVPNKPYPYREEEVSYENKRSGITLAGTLTLPDSAKPVPAVLLISGSGPNDRDETIFGHKPFLVLADYLTRRGIAVLRSDKRGVGKSGGDFAKATSADFAEDWLAALAYLRTRKEIDAKIIGLLGHSEGGLIAPMVALKDPGIAFVVLLAAPAKTGEQILYSQAEIIARASGAEEEAVQKNRGVQKIIFETIKAEPDNAAAARRIRALVEQQTKDESPEQQEMIREIAEAETKRVLTPWFRFFLTYDPLPALKQLRCPVLALTGELDTQVPAKDNLPLIEAALASRGKGSHSVKLMPGLNHLFQHAKSGLPTEYASIEETMSPEALRVIGDWILAQAR